MTISELFKKAKQMRLHNSSFLPIPASPETKRPIGSWKPPSYSFEKDFQKREHPGCNLGFLVSDDYIVIDIDNKPPCNKLEQNRPQAYQDA